MITPLPRQNLLHYKIRTLVTVLAVSFAIMFIFFQFGLYEAILDDTIKIYSKLRFDLIAVSPVYQYIGNTGTYSVAKNVSMLWTAAH